MNGGAPYDVARSITVTHDPPADPETALARSLVEVQFHLGAGGDEPLLSVRFRCGCGLQTGYADVRHDAAAAIRRHLAEEHSDAVGFGICTRCDEITDYFHAVVADLDTDVWACERCGPKVPTVLDQA